MIMIMNLQLNKDGNRDEGEGKESHVFMVQLL